MFSKNTLLALALLLVAINAQSLAFDLRGIKYAQSNDFWDVDVPCTGGSGQYAFEYDLPSGWRFENNRIRIPSSSVQQTKNQYVVRCRVKDVAKGDVLERSLVFKPFFQGSSFSLEVSDREYFYGSVGVSAASDSGASIHGVDVLNRLSSLVNNLGSISFNVGNSGASSAGVGSGMSIRGESNGFGQSFGSGSFSGSSGSSVSVSGSSGYASIYSSLPSSLELDKIINAAAIVEIIKTIQLVVESKIRCEAKSAYLADFLGRINAAIEIKKFTLNELKAIVTQALAQIQKLTVQITTIKSAQAALNLTQLKSQLDQLVIQLKAAYEEYNKFTSTYQSYEVEITTLEKEITEINIKYSEVQKNLQKWKKAVQQIDTEIADYELRIKGLREKKSVFIQDITKAETFVRESDIKIKAIREKITIIKAKITTASTTIESLKKAYLEIEVKVNSVKTAYESANAQYIKYEREITSITVEIERYQKQTSELEGKQVTQQIENLQSAITEIKTSIDFIKYKCFNAGNIEIDTDDKGKGCYHFGQNQWFSYVGNFYENLSEQIRNRIAKSFSNQIIEISNINIFSDLWKQNYGSVFDKDIAYKGQNWKNDVSFKFDSDFSCATDFSSLLSRSGMIQDIRANAVDVRGDDGKDYTLRLGSCSSFEGQGKNFLPSKGQNILWKGAQNGGAFNLHSCTCY